MTSRPGRVRWLRVAIVVAVISGALLATAARAPLPQGWDGVTLCYPVVGPVQRLSPELTDSARLRIKAHEDEHASDCSRRGSLPYFVELATARGRLRAEARANCAEARQQLALGRNPYVEFERLIDDLRYGHPWFKRFPDSVLRGAVRDACPDLAAAATEPPWASHCSARPGAPRLDHVILAVRDLDSLAAQFRALGFRLKDGRPHPNGLLNKHIKFRDGTEIELMTVRGEATDRMAREYQALIAEGDGGAYVALRLASLDSVEAVATRLNLGPRRSSAGPWQFLSFEPRSPLGAVFFVAGGAPAVDPDSIFVHADSAKGLFAARVEGGPELGTLLEALGATTCDRYGVVAGHPMHTLALEGRQQLVLIPPTEQFPRPVVVTLYTGRKAERAPMLILPSFALSYR